jgi:predicted nucleic acid-binding protein
MSNSWICVDASLIVRLVADPADVSVHQLWERWSADNQRIAAPTLLFYEITNALYQYERHGLLTPASAQLAQGAALELPIDLYSSAGLHRRALELALRLSLPATYDAHYLALADELQAELWTADRRLVQAVSGSLSWVRQA